jgi:hypothetical protein
MMASKNNVDWIEALDEELEKTAQEIVKDISQTSQKKIDLTKTLLADIWRVWLRFNRINVTFKMEPEASSFLRFRDYPNEWDLKNDEEFDYGGLNQISLIDVSPFQNRTGDALKVLFYPKDGETYVKMIFEFCEGEHYYKLAGWKRIFVQYILYEAPHRIEKLINEIASKDPHRELYLIKEATKLHQTSFKDSAKELKEILKNSNTKGEWTVVIEPKSTSLGNITSDDILSLNIPKKEAAKLLSKITGKPTKTCYNELLQK